MLEEYRALRNAIRRPLRRWWRRVGWVWLLAISLLLLADLLIRAVLIPILERGSQAATGASGTLSFTLFLNLPPYYWANVGAVLACLARGLTYCLAILVAQQATRHVSALLRDYPHPAQGASRRLMFLLACASCWPVALLWLIGASGALTALAHGSGIVQLGEVTAAWSYFPVATEPWTTLIALLWIIAVLVSSRSSAPAWCWALALGWMPVLLALVELAQILSLYTRFKFDAYYADLPYIEMGLGWIGGGVCSLLLVRCLVTGRERLGYAPIVLLALSALLSGYGGTVPFVRHRPVAGGLAQIEAASAAGMALDFVRSLNDFVASPLVAYQEFDPSRGGTEWSAAPVAGAAGALVVFVPVQWVIPTGAWARWLVAPLNLAYLGLLLWCMSALLFAVPRLRPGVQAVGRIQR